MKVAVFDHDPAEEEIAGARNGHEDLISAPRENEWTKKKIFARVFGFFWSFPHLY